MRTTLRLAALVLGLAAEPAGADRVQLHLGWIDPGAPLAERVEQTRGSALEYGLRNVEPAARALLASPPPEGAVAGARGAVRLAPDLPAAHMGLALALWREDFAVLPGLGEAVDAVRAFERSLEASLWWRATALWIAVLALIGGAMGFVALLAAKLFRHVAHDLGDAIHRNVPSFSRAALLGSLVLAPALAGEGLIGLSLALLAVGVLHGSTAQRRASVVAGVLLLVGVHPLSSLAARAFGALGADPVATAAYTAEYGLASPIDLIRLERAAATDPLAARALALGAKRRGDLIQADARYTELRESAPDDPVLLNNAANIRLALGDSDGAIRLYKKALDAGDSAVILFNLSQAWGVALKVDELDRTLARAQKLDPTLVEDLSEIQGRATHFVADLPVPIPAIRERLLYADDGSAVAAALRRPFAPGRLGRAPSMAWAALAGTLAAAWLLGGRFQHSGACRRCGGRVCPRCDRHSATPGLCRTCSRLFHRPESTDSTLRAARLERLRGRQERMERLGLAASLLVPGAAGMLADRPGLALAGTLSFCAAVATFAMRHGVGPDPLAAGAAGPLVFGLVGGLLAVLYLGVLGAAFAAQRGA